MGIWLGEVGIDEKGGYFTASLIAALDGIVEQLAGECCLLLHFFSIERKVFQDAQRCAVGISLVCCFFFKKVGVQYIHVNAHQTGVLLKVGLDLVQLLYVAGIGLFRLGYLRTKLGERVVFLDELLVGCAHQLCQTGNIAFCQLLCGYLCPVGFCFGCDDVVHHFVEVLVGHGTGIRILAGRIDQSMSAVQHRTFVFFQCLIPSRVEEAVSIQHIAQCTGFCILLGYCSPEAVIDAACRIRQHIIGGVAVAQVGGCCFARDATFLLVVCVDFDAAASEAIADVASMYFTSKHTCTDACPVGDDCIDDTEILDCATAADAAEQACFLSVCHIYVEIEEGVSLSVECSAEVS